VLDLLESSFSLDECLLLIFFESVDLADSPFVAGAVGFVSSAVSVVAGFEVLDQSRQSC
jgi:hypothetical protein